MVMLLRNVAFVPDKFCLNAFFDTHRDYFSFTNSVSVVDFVLLLSMLALHCLICQLFWLCAVIQSLRIRMCMSPSTDD